uniref:trypsin n=1 Tax=Anopheles dirus TaxID=7168 RepID=A0A182N1Q8_9DIPT
MFASIVFVSLAVWVGGGIGSPVDCSFRSMKPIIGGSDAKDGAAPYQVSLQLRNEHRCGGSIISDRWILTAKHCLKYVRDNQTKVVVGTNDLEKGGLSYDIDLTISYNSSVNNDFDNDIALLRLAAPLKFGKHVQKIEYSDEPVPDNATVTVYGWGVMVVNGILQKKTTKLQTIDLLNVALERCQAIYGRLNRPIHEDQLCTFTKRGEGTCHGDSGGALVWQKKQVGIVSKSFICAFGMPDVYVSIPYYYNWIREMIERHG